MKTLIFIFGLIYSLSSSSQISSNEERMIVKNMQAQEKCWNNGDIKGFMQYYWNSDSLQFVGSRGITFGWQKTLDNYLKSYPSREAMGILSFTILETKLISQNYAHVIGKWDLKREKPAGGYFTLLWKKIDGKWFIVVDHTS